jgi:hypothetical protein
VSTRSLCLLVVAVLIASAGLFAIGVAIERNSKHHERAGEAHGARGHGFAFAADTHPAEAAGETGPEQRDEGKGGESAAPTTPGSESSGSSKPGHREAGPESAHRGEPETQRASEKESERVFGIDTESTGLVIAAVGASLLFALALWFTTGVAVPLALAGFALVAAIFDVREVFHQIDESRTNLTVIAAIVAALHLVVVGGALTLAQRAKSGPASAGTR